VTRADAFPIASAGTYVGRYRLVEEIGVGGMASVYLARMDGAGGFQKWVALKRVHPHLVEDEHFIRMFLDEARIAASISHPNVAQVFDLGSEGNTHWIAMEYLHGEPLRELMRYNADIGRPMRPELAARIVADAAEGLHAAHELRGKNGEPLNLVHRDVTPHNLFITYDGVVKVVDFGIAKVAGRLASTRAGTLKGKIAYMAPEQIRGRDIDRRADIFALGVVLWELTTNRRLFRTDSDLETLERVQRCIVPPPSSVLQHEEYPVELESIVMRCLRRDRDERYSSARDLSRALHQYLMVAGEFVTPAEIGAYVTKLFADRISQREEHLRRAAEFTETFSADLPATLGERGSSTNTVTSGTQDTRVDVRRSAPVPRPTPAPRPAPRPRPTTAAPGEESRATIDSLETVVAQKRAVVSPAADDSISTVSVDVPEPAMIQPIPISPETGLPRLGTIDGDEDDDEENIETKVASAAGTQQAAVFRVLGPLPDSGVSAGDADPARPLRPLGSDRTNPASSESPEGLDAEVLRMKPRWTVFATYVAVFVLSAVIVFALASLMIRARGGDTAGQTPAESSRPEQSSEAKASTSAGGATPIVVANPSGSNARSGTAGASTELRPGYLTIVCVPDCTHVEVDGRDLGPLVSRVPTPPGEYRVTLRSSSGTVRVVSVVVVSGEHTIQHISMY